MRCERDYSRSELRQNTTDRAAYRRPHRRTRSEGCKGDGADRRRWERVRKNTELRTA